MEFKWHESGDGGQFLAVGNITLCSIGYHRHPGPDWYVAAMELKEHLREGWYDTKEEALAAVYDALTAHYVKHTSDVVAAVAEFVSAL